MVLLFFCMISLSGCQKEEWNIESVETEESAVVEGRVITSNGTPLANVVVKVDFHKTKWLAYYKTRHKAETTTDKNGKYRLFFTVKDDELETEADKNSDVNKDYSLIFDMKNLDSKKYFMASDMVPIITSVDPPMAELAEEVDAKIDLFVSSFERGKTYTQNLYIPQKRYIQVTLKGFIPKAGDYFSVSSAFPYGFEMDPEQGHHFPDTPYGYGKMNDYLFALHDAEQKTYQVPCALNENNILTLIRKKDGVYHAEEHQLFVTEDTPENLVYEY